MGTLFRLLFGLTLLLAGLTARAVDFTGTFDVSRVGRVLQFVTDPKERGLGWVLTERVVQVNREMKSGGPWRIKFDRAVFERMMNAVPTRYVHKKIQLSRSRKGTLYLLVEADLGGKLQRYILITRDYGDNWELFQKNRKRVARKQPKPTREPPPGEEEAVDLGELNDEPQGKPQYGSSRGGTQPLFRIFFDLLLNMRSGSQPWTFDNFHSLTLVEVFPQKDIHFSFELSPSPRYYELAYKLSERLKFRFGRIWIPFGNTNPHNFYGGFNNTSLLRQPGTAAFLPDVWTDLGLSVRYQFADSSAFSLSAELYGTNGFQVGGDDPVGEVGLTYPNFENAPNPDNNADKAIGAKVEMGFQNTIKLSASGYTSQYNNQGDEALRMTLLGVDGELSPIAGTRIRGGYLFGTVGLPEAATDDNFVKGGFYAEFEQRLGPVVLTVRGGASQNDNRISDPSDQEIIGGSIRYRSGIFIFGFQYFRDLLDVPGKTTRDYTAFRVAAIF